MKCDKCGNQRISTAIEGAVIHYACLKCGYLWGGTLDFIEPRDPIGSSKFRVFALLPKSVPISVFTKAVRHEIHSIGEKSAAGILKEVQKTNKIDVGEMSYGRMKEIELALEKHGIPIQTIAIE